MARRRKPLTQRLTEAYNAVFGFGSRDTRYRAVTDFTGGIRSTSGAGTSYDKTSTAYFTPTIWTPENLEVIYRESWAASRAIDMPVNDMFLRTPEFKAPKKKKMMPENPDDPPEQNMMEADEGDPNEKLMEAIDDTELYMHIKEAMKAGCLHGTGFLIIATKGGRFDAPLDIDAMMPNDLIGFFTCDKWNVRVESYQENLMKPRYMMPERYWVSLGLGMRKANDEWLKIHHSRVIRFDGIRPISKRNPSSYQDRDFGESMLTRIIKAVIHEELADKGVTHLTQEASIPIVKSPGFQDSLEAGNFSASTEADEVSTEQVAEEINRMLSTYRILFADAEGDVSRVNVPFGGIADLLDRYAAKIAATVGIPVTRFLCKSPIGLQSTGSGEERDYARDIKSRQENDLRPILQRLFKIIGKSIGVEVPKFAFPSIIDISDAEKAETAHKWFDAANLGITAGIMDENEAREMIQEAVPEANHLDPLSDAEMENLRHDPVIEAQIDKFKSESERNRRDPPSNSGGGN